jgi:hypothetical protein
MACLIGMPKGEMRSIDMIEKDQKIGTDMNIPEEDQLFCLNHGWIE